ncbi:cytidylate kinase [Oxalobacteraceae bacterium GrIS 2.11]
MNAVPIITIDGPTASGKGTVAQFVADALHFRYLDSGALYRLVAYAALKAQLALNDEAAISKIAGQLPCRFVGQTIFLGDEEVTDAIRTEEISKAASKIAVLPSVRKALFQFQQDFATEPGLVADGRDMGTVVFPNAVLKIFLTANIPARAERRFKQLISKGFSASMDDLLQDLTERDERDRNRLAAPLKPAPGAYLLDTSELTVEQAVSEVLKQYAAAQSST